MQSYISLHRNKKGVVDSLEVISFMFNEIVVKAVIYLAQIKKIEFIRNIASSQDPNRFSEYYLHLAYPPKYFVSLLRPDVACDDGYLHGWERV